jgi:hypothetical protein
MSHKKAQNRIERTSQEEGLAPALPSKQRRGQALFLTRSFFEVLVLLCGI